MSVGVVNVGLLVLAAVCLVVLLLGLHFDVRDFPVRDDRPE